MNLFHQVAKLIFKFSSSGRVRGEKGVRRAYIELNRNRELIWPSSYVLTVFAHGSSGERASLPAV
jgi:hypothetical protein